MDSLNNNNNNNHSDETSTTTTTTNTTTTTTTNATTTAITNNNTNNNNNGSSSINAKVSNKNKSRFKWTKEKSQVAMNLVKYGCKPKLVSVAVGCSLRTAQKFVETVTPKMEGESFKNYEIRRRGRKSKDVNQRLEAIREVLSKDSTKTQVEIAADLKVSNTTVCRDLKRIGGPRRERKNNKKKEQEKGKRRGRGKAKEKEIDTDKSLTNEESSHEIETLITDIKGDTDSPQQIEIQNNMIENI